MSTHAELVAPSGLTYRLNGRVLEVEWDGQWIEADQVNAEDCVALMEWHAGVAS